MKMYVFQYNYKVSGNYHEGGGLMVVAENTNHVKEMIEKEEYIEITNEEWQEVVVYELMDNEKPRIFVFPDAGCC
jgi:hypothetical protein